MSIDHGKLLALADAPPIPAWLIDADQSRVWAAAWETLHRTLAQPAEAPHCKGHAYFDDGCIDCSDALERQRKGQSAEAAQGAVAGENPCPFCMGTGACMDCEYNPGLCDTHDAAQGAVAHTMINHERDPHCIGCYVIRWNDGDPVAECNECGHHVALLDQLVTHPQAAPAQGDGRWPATKEEMEAYWEAYSAHRVHGEGEAIRAGLAAYQALRAAAPSREPGS